MNDNRLSEQRDRSRLTQQEVAKFLDVNHTTVCKHEAGRGLTAVMIAAYASLYKVQEHELFFEAVVD